jgi:uncharacterized protein DUF4157
MHEQERMDKDAAGKAPARARQPSGRADQAGRLPGPAGSLSPSAVLALQRTAGNAAVARAVAAERHEHGSGCGHEQPVQRRSAVQDVLSTPGRPLDDGLRSEMESRFGGADFSDVRVHSDHVAQRSASEIGARAYTSGSDVVIGEGGGDKHTLAHELTHVIQQRQGPVAGADNGAGLRISDPSDRFEQEAEASARRVMSGAPVQRAPRPPHAALTTETAAHLAVQRAGNDNAAATSSAATAVSIAEGEVSEVGPGGTITYPSVTSCLVITAYLRDGSKVGAHASLYRMGTGLYSDQILPELKRRIGSKRGVERIDVSGAVSSWNPEYLKKAIERSDKPAQQKNDPTGIGDVVAKGLGRQRKKVTVREVPDGTLTR